MAGKGDVSGISVSRNASAVLGEMDLWAATA